MKIKILYLKVCLVHFYKMTIVVLFTMTDPMHVVNIHILNKEK